MRRWVDQLRIRGREGAEAVAPLGEVVKGLRKLAMQGEALPRAAASLEKTGEELAALTPAITTALDQVASGIVSVLRDGLLEIRADMKEAVEDTAAITRQAIEPIVQAGVERSLSIVGDGIEALTETLHYHLDIRSESDAALVARLAESHRLFAEQVEAGVRERTGALLDRLDASAAALGDAAREQQAALAVAVGSAEARVAHLEAEAGQRLHELFDLVRRGSEQQADAYKGFEERLAEGRASELSALREALERDRGEVAHRLTDTAEAVRDAAALVHSGGAEMSALAESFSQAVERHREASGEWIARLGDVEGAVDRAGRGAAAEALGAQLAATEAILARQLDFQCELFEQLRALRRPLAESRGDRGDATEGTDVPDSREEGDSCSPTREGATEPPGLG